MAAAALVLAHVTAAAAQVNMAELGIEELMGIEVTSVSRRGQRRADTAAAVHVVTSEDIRRSGAQTIPEALRWVPGLHVARMDSNKWSVSVRGFTGRYSNKLLVLVDGRTVYAPLFSGVVWDMVNVPLHLIERIEVVRGPGATLWGANAVNGVINIVTREAAATRGVQLHAVGGSEERGIAALTLGAPVGARSSIRADVGLSRFDGTARSLPAAHELDEWQGSRIGVRFDSTINAWHQLTLQGAFAGSDIDDGWLASGGGAPGVLARSRNRHSVGFLNAEWTARHTRGDTVLRGVLERTYLREAFADERRVVADVDLQRSERLGTRHELVAGASYRHSRDTVGDTPGLTTVPAARTLSWGGVFAQDEIRVVGSTLRAVVGAKAEHNSYTGWEFQPSLRGIVSLSGRQSVWGAVSRAVRLPSRAEADGLISIGAVPLPTSPLPATAYIRGAGASARAETLVARELGYRYQFGAAASVDATIFQHDYTRLRDVTPAGAPALVLTPSPHVELPLVMQFTGAQQRHGVEVTGEWRPLDMLRIQSSYSWLGGTPRATLLVDDDAPAHQAYVRTALTLPWRVELDTMTRSVSALRRTNIPGYVTMDARAGVRVGQVSLAVIGRNLFTPQHLEFVPEIFSIGQASIERSVALQVALSR